MSKVKLFKTVALPIEVPDGDFCFGGKSQSGHIITCGNFDNDGGHPTCRFNLFWDAKYDKENRIPRPKKCLELKEI
jgi:hypothetical protein